MSTNAWTPSHRMGLLGQGMEVPSLRCAPFGPPCWAAKPSEPLSGAGPVGRMRVPVVVNPKVPAAVALVQAACRPGAASSRKRLIAAKTFAGFIIFSYGRALLSWLFGPAELPA